MRTLITALLILASAQVFASGSVGSASDQPRLLVIQGAPAKEAIDQLIQHGVKATGQYYKGEYECLDGIAYNEKYGDTNANIEKEKKCFIVGRRLDEKVGGFQMSKSSAIILTDRIKASGFNSTDTNIFLGGTVYCQNLPSPTCTFLDNYNYSDSSI